MAELAFVERTVTKRLVEMLPLHGLAKKNAMMRDRRYTQMSPTARGAQLVSTADEAVDHSRMRLFSGIDDAEDTFLLESLTRLPSNATEGTAKLTTCA